MNWKIGDIAICINNSDLAPHLKGNSPPLVKNAEYQVLDVHECANCGAVSLDVGLIAHIPTWFCLCGTNVNSGGHWFCCAKRFIKKQDLQTELDLAVANEEYEKAEEINTLIKKLNK